MRRPILGNGFPKLIPNNVDPVTDPDLALQVFDLRNVPEDIQSRCFFLTLYGYFSEGADTSNCQIAQQDGALTPIFVTAAQIPTGQTSVPTPIKILDRFPMRGPQRIVAANKDAALPARLSVFGYVEIEDTDAPDPQGLRPLQIGNTPVKPYLGGAREIANTTTPIVLHQLNAGYIDEITLDCSPEGAGEFGPAGYLSLSTGETLLLVQPSNASNGLVRLFDGIPMRSPGALTSSDPAAAPTTKLRVVGTFKRY